MAQIKTMRVIQLATGNAVTINARDFDAQRYALEGQAPAPTPPAPARRAPEAKPVVTHDEVSTMLSALDKEHEAKPEPPDEVPAPRRRGR